MAKAVTKTNAELLKRTRENAVEMAVRAELQRRFGSYTIDGELGTITRDGDAPVINYRVLAMAALAASDLFDAEQKAA